MHDDVPSIPGYQITARAGSGGAGTVYYATRDVDGLALVIKVLHGAGSEAERRLRAEFSVLSTLEHPGLASMHDFGVLPDGRAWLAMDRVDGVSLSRDAVFDDDGSFVLERFARVVLELASALGYIHAHGVIHADLKPANISVVTRDEGPSITLLDFGLAHLVRAHGDGMSGTVEYLAPELIRGESPSPATDLYALGCALYEVLTGDPPFTGDHPLDVLRAHLRQDAESVDRRVRVPDAVSRLVMTLLARDPHLRYRSCAPLFEDAAKLLGSDRLPDFERTLPPPRLPDIPRARELAKVLEAVERAEGGAQVVAVEGAPGAGKTRLLRTVRTEALLRGHAVTWVSFRPDVPVLAAVAAAIGRQLNAEALVHARVLAESFPDLFPELEAASEPALDATARRLRLVHAVSWLLAHTADVDVAREGEAPASAEPQSSGRPAARLLVFDDVAAAGEPAVEFLHSFLAFLDANDVRNLTVVLAVERDGAAFAPATHGRRAVIPLGSLTMPEMTSALQSIFDGRVSPSFLSVVHRQSGGLPGRIEEVLAFCIEEGIIEQSAHGWLVHEKENLGSYFPKSVAAAWTRAIARCGTEELLVLRALAASPVRVDEAMVSDVTGLAPVRVRAATIRLERTGLLERANQGEWSGDPASPVESGSDLLPLPEALSAQVRMHANDDDGDRRLHDAIAAWYRDHALIPAEDVIAHHLAHGSRPEQALPHLLSAARARERRFDYPGAERLLSTALPLADASERPEQRFDVLLLLADISDVLGKRDVQEECIDELLGVAATSSSPERLGLVYRRHARFLLATSRFDRARKASERALAAFVRSGDRLQEAQCYRDMGAAEHRMKPGPGVIELYEKARRIFREEGALIDEGNALVDIGLVYYSVLEDAQRALACFDEARGMFERAGDARGLARAHGNTGAQLFQLGRTEEALAAHARANDCARSIGDRRLIAISLGSMGQCELALCRFSPALLHFQEELRIAREIRDAHLEQTCLENLGELSFLLGDYEESIAAYERASALASESGNALGVLCADIDISASLIARGEVEAALRRLTSARTGLTDVHDVFASAMLEYRTGMAYLARGPHHDPSSALRAFRELGEIADQHALEVHIVLSRSYAAVCSMHLGNVDAAIAMSNEAMALLERLGDIRGGSQDVLANHAAVLKAARDTAGAAEAIGRAYERVMAYAGSIADPRLARSFLEQVRINADIIREYALAHRGDSKDALAAVKDQNLRVLYTVARKINSTLDLTQLLDTIMDSALEAMNAERGMIFLIEDEQLVLKVSRNVERETIQDATEISLSILQDVVRRGHPVIVSDTSKDDAFKNRDSVVNFRIHSLICVPMISKEALIGTVYVDSRMDALSAMTFSELEAEFLEAFANLATMAIENARLHSRLQAENLYLRKEVERRFGFENIIGDSAPMHTLFSETEAAIANESSVLIYGESGTGKELIARAIHYNGSRRNGRFVAVDCGALPDTLLESELFGYRRGAFTGAYTDKSGLFEEAHNGTLFLDEISNTSLAFQAKLLRVLQEGEYRRVGDTATRVANVRIISATNRNLQEEIAQGRFRQDLFYRLNVIPITVPPLRDRISDIPLLIDHFIQRHLERGGRPVRGASRELIEYLGTLPWTGNVRELENLVLRMVSTGNEDMLALRDLPSEYLRENGSMSSPVPQGAIAISTRQPQRLARLVDVEREHIRYVLTHTEGNKSEAAKVLGLKRTTLVERMKKLGMM